MNAFVILSEAKDLTTGVSNTKRLARDQSFAAFAGRDDSALDTRIT
jgi:hypothetical protein